MQIANMTSFHSQGLMQGTQATALTEDQQNKAQEIIAQYDVDDFSAEDALSMRKELKSAGVHGKNLQEMLKDFPKPEEQKAPPSTTEEIKEANDPKAVLLQLLDQKESGAIAEKDFHSQMAELKQEAIGSVLNTQA